MILLTAKSAMMILGAFSLHVRLAAGCCLTLCGCLNLACIITTGVFRFNSWGKLSTLCDGPSKFVDNDSPLSDDRTVSGDAALIVGLWICQMLFCCTNCFHMGYAGKPSPLAN